MNVELDEMKEEKKVAHTYTRYTQPQAAPTKSAHVRHETILLTSIWKITFKLPIPFFAIGLQINNKSVSKKQWTSICLQCGKAEKTTTTTEKKTQINVHTNFMRAASLCYISYTNTNNNNVWSKYILEQRM